MNPNASLLDRAGLDKVRVGKLIDRGLEGADDRAVDGEGDGLVRGLHRPRT